MRLIDTHCHVHFNAYKDDMDEVIARSLKEGVAMITVGTQFNTSKKGVEVASAHEGLWAAVGLHPSHTYPHTFVDDDEIPQTQTIASREEIFDKDLYRTLAQHPKCVAIGECGLDYYRLEGVDVGDAKRRQEAAFRAQIELAQELDLPLVLHAREAHEQTMAILREYASRGTLRGVAHCFSGTPAQAQDFFAIGFLVSVTGIVTFKPRKGEGEYSTIQQVVQQASLSQIMVETDAPYLTPAPHRGERNEPMYVIEVAKKIAELKGVSLEEVAQATSANAKRLFGVELF